MMRRALIGVLLWACSLGASAATQYVCASATGSGDGSSFANCKATGANFASITVASNDLIYVCGPSVIRGTLTLTSLSNVTVDLRCNGNSTGSITGADVASSFGAPDVNGEYPSTATYTAPTWVLVNGQAWKEGVKNALADNEWAFSGGKIHLGSNPAGLSVEVGVRGIAVEAVSSTNIAVRGGYIYGTRHTGSATGNGAINCRDSTCSITGTQMYAVRQATNTVGATAVATISGLNVTLCGDGPDADSAAAGRLFIYDSRIDQCSWAGWFANTQTSHSITIDGESIACTNCQGLTAYRNIVTKANQGISLYFTTSVIADIRGNSITDTMDDGITFGCGNSSGIPIVNALSNYIVRAGAGNAYAATGYGLAWNNAACGNGPNVTFAHNVVIDSADGINVTASAAQTGTLKIIDNVIVNANPVGASGSHYFTNLLAVNIGHALTISANNNRYYQTKGTAFFGWVGNAPTRNYASFASYQSDAGSQESASTLGDPMMTGGLLPVDITSTRPLPGSPLCNAAFKAPPIAGTYYDGQRFAQSPAVGALGCP